MAVRPLSGTRLAAAARMRLGLDAGGDPHGPARLSEPTIARDIAHRVAKAVAGAAVTAGEVLALGLLDEVARLVVARYAERVEPGIFSRAAAVVRERVGPQIAAAAFKAYGASFPPPVDDGDAVREMLLTWLANVNPATGSLRLLVDDTPLAYAPGARYETVLAEVVRFFAAAPSFGPGGRDLVTLLRAPALAAPHSLRDQLGFVREQWAGLLSGGEGDGLLDRLVIGLGVIAEEAGALARRGAHGGPGGGIGALIGDGFGWLGLGADGADAALDPEPERFSSDVAWMPGLVLIAKSTHVWLDQLSRTYGREIGALDRIPDEELDRLARAGISGLWLIGLWQRSRASQEIKRRRGNTDALASAYALHDYAVADDLGGESAAANLRERAAARGIRLASDMVPNHMGIDARWVIEHPDWFLSVADPPFPAYSFSGPDLSSDERVAIVLEDHYWDGTDAAVVFKRVDRWTGDERYVYHGNDGTSFPWNDTAQLDYLRADVREAVIQTILHVARQFPVIRFDAAMVLAKRHIQRLWHPLPGHGGSIPSRAEHAMTKRAFDEAMPVEFWREVVDRVAAEAPGTLLLAEAFWLMEGYFVRTLGMHRVYNSAFMNLLRDEDNGTYRRVMRDTLEFDPQILGRFVNFMSNPDEKTAVEQFGTGDKHFGVATVMATMPGLPMLGHGQLEGFRERYGMEFGRAAWDEPVDEGMLARYEREIVPLLRRRAWFAGSREFLLFDFVTDDGNVNEDVYAYSNVGPGGERSLVVYHNRHATTAGRIGASVAYSAPGPYGERVLRQRTLADGLDLWHDDADDRSTGSAFVRARVSRSGLEYIWRAADFAAGRFRLELGEYDYRVYLEWATIVDVDGRWSRLAATLGGGGVASLDDALRDIELAPVHDALGGVLAATGPRAQREAALVLVGTVRAATGARRGRADRDVAAAIVGRLGALARLPGLGRRTSADVHPDLQTVARLATDTLSDETTAAAFRIGAVVEPLGLLGDAEGAAVATAHSWFTELRLGPSLERLLRAAQARTTPSGRGAVEAAAAVHRAWLLLGLARPSRLGEPGGTAPAERAARADAGRAKGAPTKSVPTDSARAAALLLAQAWLGDPDVATHLGVHVAEGERWIVAEPLHEVTGWTLALDALTAVATSKAATSKGAAGGEVAKAASRSMGAGKADLRETVAIVALLRESAASAGYRVDAWLEALAGANPRRPGRVSRPLSTRRPPAGSARGRSATSPGVNRRQSNRQTRNPGPG